MNEKKDLLSLLNKEAQMRDQGDFSGALRILDEAITLYPNHAEPFNNKGAILMMMHMYKEALPVLERSVTLNPRNGQAHNNLGWCYRMLGRPEEAVEEFEQAISNGYKHEGVYYNLGLVLLNLGRCQQGIDSFISALRINPMYGPVLNDLTKIGRYYAGISEPTTIADAEKIKAALNRWNNPKIM
jgi:tetratricopeptide (TPR) repeat protein